MRQCPECRQYVNFGGSVCPYCGHRFNNDNSGEALAAALVLMLPAAGFIGVATYSWVGWILVGLTLWYVDRAGSRGQAAFVAVLVVLFYFFGLK
jgi:uncharacterized protein (DUF983 family)